MSTDSFFIPVGNCDFNIYAVESYMRRVQDPYIRKEMIKNYGSTQSGIKSFEKENNLPEGSFELAVMLEDSRVRNINKKFSGEYIEGIKSNDSSKMVSFQRDVFSFYSGLHRLYPGALNFLTKYGYASARLTGGRQMQPELHQCQFVVGPVASAAAVVVVIAAFIGVLVAAAANALAVANAVVTANVVTSGE